MSEEEAQRRWRKRPRGEAPAVFLSHTGQDDLSSAFVEMLHEKLRVESRVGTFLDSKSIKPGVEWEREIEFCVRNCIVFVCILSENYFRRWWCMHELDIAFLGTGITIIPVFHGCNAPNVDKDKTVRRNLSAVLEKKHGITDATVLERWCQNLRRLKGIQGVRNNLASKHNQLPFRDDVVAAILEEINQREVSPNDDRTVIDAYFAVQCRRSSWLDNINGRPQSLAELCKIRDFINKSNCNYDAGARTGLKEFLTTELNICLTDGRVSDLKKKLKEASRFRLLVWCAKGNDECDGASRKLSPDLFGSEYQCIVDVVVVCMQFGARSTAKAISEVMQVGGRAVWIRMDPYGNGIFELFTIVLFQFCAVLFQDRHENCYREVFEECFQVLKQKAMIVDCKDCGYFEAGGEEIDWPHQAIRRSSDSKPHVKESLMISSHLIGLFRKRELRQLKVAAGDLEFLYREGGLFDTLSSEANEENHRYIFLRPDSAGKFTAPTDDGSNMALAKACTRCRAVALYMCYELESHLLSQHDPEGECMRRTVKGLADGIFRVACKASKEYAEEQLEEGDTSALLWLDFTKEEMKVHFPHAKALEMWIGDFGEEVVLTVILTGNVSNLAHVQTICQVFGASQVVLPPQSVVDIPVTALVGTFTIPSSVGPNDENGRGLLDAFRKAKLDFKEELEKAVFGDQYDAKWCSVTSLYRDCDGSVMVDVLVRDIKFLTILRDRGLGGQAAREVTTKLQNSQQVIQFDPNSIATLYESMILQLETLTDHQQEKLALCKEAKHVHIKAKAGTGKTFIALNSALDFMETNAMGRVLFVCRNSSLAFYFCRWLYCRSQERNHQRKQLLDRIFLLSTGWQSKIRGVEYSSLDQRLHATNIANAESLAFGMIIIDEAHDVLQRNPEGAKEKGLKESLSYVRRNSPSAKQMLLSDISQASYQGNGGNWKDISGLERYP